MHYAEIQGFCLVSRHNGSSSCTKWHSTFNRISYYEQNVFSVSGLTVRSPSGPAVVRLGSSGVLPCYVNKRLLEQIRKVEWRRTDSETLVHLYQDGESRPESQQQDYHDRAHFFTDQIQHGNFSLRLDNLRAEDEGRYTCKVYRQEDSVSLAKLNLELRLLGNDSHFMSCIIFTFGFVCLHVCANTCKNIDAGVFLKSSCKDLLLSCSLH
uniref:Ig-like domain-containing protein n=1 Tax=Sinocyclocheilus grahami TaxID=75366 RepID=A0A672NRE0_SINGR